MSFFFFFFFFFFFSMRDAVFTERLCIIESNFLPIDRARLMAYRNFHGYPRIPRNFKRSS